MKNIVKVLLMTGTLFCQAQANADNNLSLEKLLPQYISWAMATDHKGIKIGLPLNEKEILLAKEIGIKFPKKVKIVYVDEVPFPYENEQLKQMGLSFGFIGKGIVNQAQVFGYSVYVRKDLNFTFSMLAHELVHVMQVERAGSFANLVPQYFTDLAKYGYSKAPLEVEAYKANTKYGAR